MGSVLPLRPRAGREDSARLLLTIIIITAATELDGARGTRASPPLRRFDRRVPQIRVAPSPAAPLRSVLLRGRRGPVHQFRFSWPLSPRLPRHRTGQMRHLLAVPLPHRPPESSAGVGEADSLLSLPRESADGMVPPTLSAGGDFFGAGGGFRARG